MPRYDAVLFDLLTALLDSWTTWNRAAGDPVAGVKWRRRYLDLTYGSGSYRPYEEVVAAAAADVGLPPAAPKALVADWGSLAPWPEAPAALAALPQGTRTGIVTNCSVALGRTAAARIPPVDVLVTAEEAGAYKPDPRPYRLALDRLGLPPDRVLFVAGSAADLPGATGVGMTVVWHNRLRLVRPDRYPAPARELSSLLEVAPIVANGY